MLIVITYDVSVGDSEGRRRLRSIAKICQDYGMRVQNSVFECNVEPAQYISLRAALLSKYDPQKDSLRFYHLGSGKKVKCEHFGTKKVLDPSKDILII